MQVLKKLFQTKYFVINLLPDVPGAEMCGTLKNIVALAAGFIDGIGLGPNSKAAIMRQVRTAIAPVRQMMAAPGHTAVSGAHHKEKNLRMEMHPASLAKVTLSTAAASAVLQW